MNPWLTVVVALALAIAPAAIFIFIGNTWFSLRGTVPSMVGAALLFDVILRAILKSKHTAYISVSAAFALIFIIAGASETYDYQKSYKADTVCINALGDVVKTGVNRRIGIINMNATHLSEQNYFYHEHITGVTESEWALRGALIAAYGEVPPSIVPLDAVKFPFYHGWNESAKRIDGFDTLYFWDDETAALRRLVAVKTSEEGENFVYELYYFDTGALCATVTHENGYGYIELAENG